MTTQQTARPFSCKTCKKRFGHLSSLQSHQRIHTGLRIFACKLCRATFWKQWMLQQHMKTSHGATSPVQCKVCSDSFASVTELQSHLVRTHSSVLGARSVCNKVHRQALNGAHRHRKAAHRNGVVRSNSQQPETSTARRESKPTPGSGNRSVVKKRVSNGRIRHKKADHATGSDRTMLGPDIDRSSEVEPRSPVNHQIVCSPDSTTDALGNTNSIAGARDPAEENSADSSEEPRWYLGAPDGAMEEMDVSYEQETNGRKSSVSDSASQGTLDMDDVDVTSEVDSPVSHSCAGEVPLKPSSTTHSGALLHQFPERAGSPSVIRIGSTPATSPAPGSEFDSTAGNTASIGRRSLVPADGEHSPVADSVISIGSTPVASPTVLTTPCSPSGSIVDDASFATTEAASDSVPVTPGSPNNGRILDDPELLYGQCNDSCEGSITGPKAAACPRRSAASSDSDDSEILIRPRDKQRRRLARALRRQQAAVAGSPERPRGLTLSPDKPGVDSPLRVREQPSDPEEQEETEEGVGADDAASLGSSTGCGMPLLEQMPRDSPRTRHLPPGGGDADKEMPCIEAEFPVLERQTTISPDYRRCDMKEELLTSSTDQESPNSAGSVEPSPPNICRQYGPSAQPTSQVTRPSAEQPVKVLTKEIPVSLFRFQLGDTSFEDTDEVSASEQNDEHREQTMTRKRRKISRSTNHEIRPESDQSKESQPDDGKQMGFFDVFTNFLQKTEKNAVQDKGEVVKVRGEKRRSSGKSSRSREKSRRSREDEEGPLLGEFRVETADPTVLKISRVAPKSRSDSWGVTRRNKSTPSPQPREEERSGSAHAHLVASTNGTVLTLRRVSASTFSSTSSSSPVGGACSSSPHSVSNSLQRRQSVSGEKYEEDSDIGVKSEKSPVGGDKGCENSQVKYEAVPDADTFTANEQFPDEKHEHSVPNGGTNAGDCSGEQAQKHAASGNSNDGSSGTYTLRKRKKVDFNLLAEGNVSDHDLLADPPRLPRRVSIPSIGYQQDGNKKVSRVRKKKPFDKAHFMNYHRRLVRLRRGICVLLETLFPEMRYPRSFNAESHAVDLLVEYVYNIVEDRELASSRISRCYGDIDWDLTVLVCSTPKDCLRNLRRRVMRLLKVMLPGLKVNRYFDHGSASVDSLIEEVTFENAQHLAALTESLTSENNTPEPGELVGSSGATLKTGCTTSSRPKSATVTKAEAEEQLSLEATGSSSPSDFSSLNPVKSTAKRKHAESTVTEAIQGKHPTGCPVPEEGAERPCPVAMAEDKCGDKKDAIADANRVHTL